MKTNLSTKLTRTIALGAILMPSLAQAHPGHSSSLAAGVAHPLSGFDHLAVLLGVGLWAAQLGTRARFAVPMAFLSAMAAGGVLGVMGVTLPGIEQSVAASVLIVGLVLAAGGAVSAATGQAMAGAFALFHGLVHGSELPIGLGACRYEFGVLLSSAALLGCGLGLGAVAIRVNQSSWIRMAGAAIFMAGLLSFPGPF